VPCVDLHRKHAAVQYTSLHLIHTEVAACTVLHGLMPWSELPYFQFSITDITLHMSLVSYVSITLTLHDISINAYLVGSTYKLQTRLADIEAHKRRRKTATSTAARRQCLDEHGTAHSAADY
jgi:hypothetical protein